MTFKFCVLAFVFCVLCVVGRTCDPTPLLAVYALKYIEAYKGSFVLCKDVLSFVFHTFDFQVLCFGFCVLAFVSCVVGGTCEPIPMLNICNKICLF